MVRPGGLIRLLEYVRPRGTLRRIVSRLWDPWIAWAYGASFDRQTERHALAAGLEIVESRYVVDDLVKLLTLRAHYRVARAADRRCHTGQSGFQQLAGDEQWDRSSCPPLGVASVFANTQATDLAL